MRLSVIICTHNRAEILNECLEAISPLKQDVGSEAYEVLVVDNYSSDHTDEVVASYCQQYSNYLYVLEEKIGLSHARNTGYKNSQSEWVAYLDDDALASGDFVSRCLYVILNYDFDMFGGMYYPWHKYPKPKWLSDDFGEKEYVCDKVEETNKRGCISGGIMAIKRGLLVQVGGFSTAVGMSGSKVGYGEDNYLEEKLRNQGYSIGFDPRWSIQHLVASYKLRPIWHVKKVYAQYRDKILLYGVKQPGSISAIFLLPMIFFYFTKALVGSIVKMVTKPNYFWQNALIDAFTPTAIVLGNYVGTKAFFRSKK